MPTFPAPDGTLLAHHASGDGPPLVCLPGGPMQASAHLGLERLDLLGHSAGANLAVRYAADHPDRVARLVLVTPSVFAVGIETEVEDRLATARLRSGEPWYPQAREALLAVNEGRATPEAWQALTPLWYGRWDETARARHAAEAAERNQEAAAVHMSEGALTPARTRRDLAALRAPVLILAGEVDVAAPPRAMRQLATLFPHAEVVTLPGAGHMPWRDDADRFVEATAAFLDAAAFSPAP
jgi:pimeloyl-ACP methyl ester carboxylesterase